MEKVGRRRPGLRNDSLILPPLLCQQPVHKVLLADLVHGDTVVTDESPLGVPGASRSGASDLSVEPEGQEGERDGAQDAMKGRGRGESGCRLEDCG